jgi:rubrerythrin
METREQILEILKKAYQIEVDGYTFYSMTAEKCTKDAAKELFDKLARDEVQHQSFLRDVLKNYDQSGIKAFHTGKVPTDWEGIRDKLFTQKFKDQAKGAAFEMGVLSVGMTLETNAVSYFGAAAQQAQEKEVKEFYQFLADWEKQHFDALQGLYNEIRSDFWAMGGFSPS